MRTSPAPQAVSSFTMRPRLPRGTTSGAALQLSWEDEGVLGPQPPQPGKSRSDVLHLQPLSIFVVGEMVQMVSKKLRSPWDTLADWGFILKCPHVVR